MQQHSGQHLLSAVADHGGLEVQMPPHFCQDGARDFLKIDEKIGVGWGSSIFSEKQRA